MSEQTFPFIIGLAGPAGSGKSTIAELLEKSLHCHPYRYSFAQPIRKMLASIGIDSTYLHQRKNDKIPDFGVTARHLMRTLGTEWGRAIHPDFWVHIAKLEYTRLRPITHVMLIDDVRFENEAVFIRSNGGRVVHVCRLDTEFTADHASECGVKPEAEDLTIINNGNMRDLRNSVTCLAKQLHE